MNHIELYQSIKEGKTELSVENFKKMISNALVLQENREYSFSPSEIFIFEEDVEKLSYEDLENSFKLLHIVIAQEGFIKRYKNGITVRSAYNPRYRENENWISSFIKKLNNYNYANCNIQIQFISNC